MKLKTEKPLLRSSFFLLTFLPLMACAGSAKTAAPVETTTVEDRTVTESVKNEKPVEAVAPKQEEKPRPVECLHPFGKNEEDSLEMRRTFSIYQEEVENKNYTVAYPMWHQIMAKAPCARIGPYNDAETMFPALIKDDANKARKEALIDSFMWSFERKIYFHDAEGVNKGRWAYYLNIYRPKEFKKVIELCERAIVLEGNKLEYFIPSTYINAAVLGVKNKLLGKVEILNAYDKVVDIIDYNVRQGGTYGPYWKNVQESLEETIKNYITGADIDELFLPKWKANPDDTKLMERMVLFYRASKSFSNPNYIKVLQSLFDKKPDANTAEELGKFYENNNDLKNACNYLEQAASMSTDDSRKETLYIKLGANYLKLNNAGAAQTSANRASTINPNNGNAIIIQAIARYTLAQNNCTESFDKKAAAWVTIDMLQRAMAVDPSVKDDAQKSINSYKGRIPTKEEAFFRGISAGQTYTINCLNTSTTVRFFE